jgi:hypothetical protein
MQALFRCTPLRLSSQPCPAKFLSGCMRLSLARPRGVRLKKEATTLWCAPNTCRSADLRLFVYKSGCMNPLVSASYGLNEAQEVYGN